MAVSVEVGLESGNKEEIRGGISAPEAWPQSGLISPPPPSPHPRGLGRRLAVCPVRIHSPALSADKGPGRIDN